MRKTNDAARLNSVLNSASSDTTTTTTTTTSTRFQLNFVSNSQFNVSIFDDFWNS